MLGHEETAPVHRERDAAYDWLRLLATIFVVIGHSAYLKIQTTYGGVAYQLPEMVSSAYNGAFLVGIRWLSKWVYGFHMPLFFMLSGAVLALKPIGPFDSFMRSKIRRLLIPYFVYGWFFMLPVKRIGGFYDNQGLLQALKGFLSGQDSGHLWFLTALFWSMVVFALLEGFLRRMKLDSRYLLLLVCGVLQLTSVYLPFDVLGLKKGMGYVFWFALGYVFQKERELHGNWNQRRLMTACGAAILLEMVNGRYKVLDSFFVILIGSFLIYLLAAVCSRTFKNVVKGKMWNILIRNLFYVYLFHDPLEYLVLRLFMNKGLLEYGPGCYLYVFMRTAGVFLVSVLLGELVSRVRAGAGWVFRNRNERN